MTPIQLVACGLYLAAALLQIGALLNAWIKTGRVAKQERAKVERILELHRQHEREAEELRAEWDSKGGWFRNADYQEASAAQNARHQAEDLAAGLRPVTWDYSHVMANDMWAHVAESARQTYRLEGTAVVTGIALGTVASVVTLLPIA